jgi:lysophospholipase L1-like esterase
VGESLLHAFWSPPHYLHRNAFPELYAVNHLGFRDREWGPKPPGVTRIVLLGDSNAFGWGVGRDETYGRRIESSMRSAGQDVEVLNLARPGANTVEEAGIFAEHGLPRSPDLVLLGYTTNDVEATGASRVPSVIPARWRFFLGRLRVVLLLDATQVAWRARSRAPSSEEQAAGQAASLRALVEIGRLAERAGAPLVVVLVPALVSFEAYPHAPLHAALDDVCREHGIHLLDMLPVFRAAGVRAESLDFGDGHPNAVGHDLIARAVVDLLRQHRLLHRPAAASASPPG